MEIEFNNVFYNQCVANKDLIILSPAELANKISNNRWTKPKHIQYIDNMLVKIANSEIFRLIINMPPRHGKSELISKYFPFWYLGHFPDKRIILTSYEASFAQSWGRKVKELIEEFGEPIFKIKLNPSSRSAKSFDIKEHYGGMACAGAGGAITGKGADLIIIDDPVKNDKQAHSIVYRERIWDWFLATVYTRLEPEGAIIVVMTRWHEDDLCGRIIESMNNCSIINLQ